MTRRWDGIRGRLTGDTEMGGIIGRLTCDKEVGGIRGRQTGEN